ncbi:hypothetical protein [Aestuariivirga sp.]|uniref:hypothetical protein n=1 Tax=Aestuariivirga sp. TaxID=2650926 RepID=UPI0039E6F399
MYTWIDIAIPQDYTKLITLIGSEYDLASVVPRLQADISPAVKGILIEFDYVDKDYRSTYYNFYAKKGRTYAQECVRLHFFDDTISFDEPRLELVSSDKFAVGIQDHYFGFIVLRPTLLGTIGRSVLSPNIRMGATGSTIQSTHHVHLLGHRLQLSGFPSMDQHTDISVCAHVACWSILRHYSERYPQHRELLMHDVTILAHQFNPGGLVPANGLDVNEAERVFQQANTFPLIVTKTSDNQESFYRQMIAYLESCFPLFVAMYGDGSKPGHAVAVIGHAWGNSASVPSGADDATAWHQMKSVVVVDDNHLPYKLVPVLPDGVSDYTAEDFDSFIVPLPEKIFYPAEAVDQQYVTLAKTLSSFMHIPQSGDLIVRYFVTTLSKLRSFARDQETNLGSILTNSIMQLDAAQFVWIVEFASCAQWDAGHIAARAVLDATASPYDTNPVWFAHGSDTGIFFDRDKVPSEGLVVDLKRTSAPLGRMEQNLKPIVSKS